MNNTDKITKQTILQFSCNSMVYIHFIFQIDNKEIHMIFHFDEYQYDEDEITLYREIRFFTQDGSINISLPLIEDKYVDKEKFMKTNIGSRIFNLLKNNEVDKHNETVYDYLLDILLEHVLS